MSGELEDQDCTAEELKEIIEALEESGEMSLEEFKRREGIE